MSAIDDAYNEMIKGSKMDKWVHLIRNARTGEEIKVEEFPSWKINLICLAVGFIVGVTAAGFLMWSVLL